MKTTILRWGSVLAAVTSAAWIVLLAALVVRCIAAPQPFPVLAKFSPFHDHLMLVDQFFSLSPVFALVALVLAGSAWFRERSFRSVRGTLITTALLFSTSLLVIAVNPCGYFSWFLS